MAPLGFELPLFMQLSKQQSCSPKGTETLSIRAGGQMQRMCTHT